MFSGASLSTHGEPVGESVTNIFDDLLQHMPKEGVFELKAGDFIHVSEAPIRLDDAGCGPLVRVGV